MLLTSPFWLLGLLPWLAAVAYLLLGRRVRVDVPFLDLWKVQADDVAVRRRFSTPPVGLILALVAVLLAVLAAAGPGVRRPGAERVAVVVDTGASMSARGERQARYAEMAAALADQFRSDGRGGTPIDLTVVPGGATVRTTAGELPAVVAALPPTAIDTAAEVARVARLRAAAGPVIVLSDHALEPASERLAEVAPSSAVANVGIARFAVRRSPRPQAMVRVIAAGAGNPSAITVRVTSGGRSTEQRVTVPAAGQTTDAFIDLPAAGATASAELVGHADAFPADDRADLTADADWPTIEPAAPVADLQRLIDVYAARRPAGERSVRVRLVTDALLLGEAESGIILPAVTTPTDPTRATAVGDHPVARSVEDWRATDVAAVAGLAVPAGFTPVVLDPAGPLVAVREFTPPLSAGRSVRQVWTALSPGGWSNRPEYVLFWSAAFDWVGHAGDAMASLPLTALSAEWTPIKRSPGPSDARWWPGVYERQIDGTRAAFGPAATPTGGVTMPREAWAAKVAAVVAGGDRVIDASPWLLVLAVAALLGAVLLWRRRTRTIEPSVPVTARRSRFESPVRS